MGLGTPWELHGLSAKDVTKIIKRKAALPFYAGKRHRCPVCGAGLARFKPIYKSFVRKLREHDFIHPIARFETLNLAAYSCPSCDASDRERLYALYLESRLAELPAGHRYRFVDFAPSLALSRWLRRHPQLDYRTADLYRTNVDDRVDLCDMGIYADQSIDMFLCSHVLEHVADDALAMRELCRVLKPDGFGIVMVPLIEGIEETQEDPAHDTPQLRWKHYCQDDHLRLYGREDLRRRLTQAGFAVERLTGEHFGATAFESAGIASNSALYVVSRPTR